MLLVHLLRPRRIENTGSLEEPRLPNITREATPVLPDTENDGLPKRLRRFRQRRKMSPRFDANTYEENHDTEKSWNLQNAEA
jgi:hypothetical protein